jgi:hypothetical protein
MRLNFGVRRSTFIFPTARGATMAASSDGTRQIFQSYIDEHGDAGPIGSLAALLATGSLRRESADGIIGSRPTGWLKPALLDLLLYYLRHVLSDHRLAPDEQITIRELKVLLRISEGDFTAHRRAEVAALLTEQLERMLHDDLIDNAEALQQVELQRAFDLSYDEYLALTRPAIEAAVERLIREVEAPASTDEERRAYAMLDALRTVHLLSAAQRHRIGHRN